MTRDTSDHRVTIQHVHIYISVRLSAGAFLDVTVLIPYDKIFTIKENNLRKPLKNLNYTILSKSDDFYLDAS